MTAILERVTFRTRPGVTEDDFLAAAQAVAAWVIRQPGFAYRTLVRDADGVWSDLVYWQDRRSAEAAAKAITAAPEARAFLAMIDGDSVQMTHLAQLQAATAADMAA